MTSKATVILQAMAPICHFDTRTGVDNATNIRLGMTQPLMLNGRRVYVPHVSENALRSSIVRTPLADHLVAKLDLSGKLPRAVLNLLYAGGAMGGADRVPGDEVAVGHAVGRLYPSLALLGGAVDAMILPRSKLRVNAWLVAREYVAAIEAVAPELADEARAVSAFDLMGDETRVRGTGAEASGNQMLYSYQVLSVGTKIVVEFGIDRWAQPAVGAALGRALMEWDGYIGGQGRQGRGRVAIVSREGLADPDLYDAHIAANSQVMAGGLTSGTLGAAKPLCH